MQANKQPAKRREGARKERIRNTRVNREKKKRERKLSTSSAANQPAPPILHDVTEDTISLLACMISSLLSVDSSIA